MDTYEYFNIDPYFNISVEKNSKGHTYKWEVKHTKSFESAKILTHEALETIKYGIDKSKTVIEDTSS